MDREKDRLIWTEHCKKAGFAKALQWAVIENDLDLLREALAAGHDPNMAEMGRKPAELAVEFKSLEALKILLAAGADEYTSKIGNNHGYSLAALAVAWDFPEALDALRERGFKTHGLDCRGYGSPLRSAVSYGRIKCAKKLIEWGAAASPFGEMWEERGLSSAMHICAQSGRVKMGKMLHAANPTLAEARGENGEAPLHWAAVGGQRYMVEWLFSVGVDAEAVDKDGKTALDWVKDKKMSRMAGLIESLVAKRVAEELSREVGEVVQTASSARPKPRL